MLGQLLYDRKKVERDTPIKHQRENMTLKFRHHSGRDASLLLADTTCVSQARLASEIIKTILDDRPDWRRVIANVLCELRACGALNQHGADVGQHLKTAPAVLWCICCLTHPDAGEDMRDEALGGAAHVAMQWLFGELTRQGVVRARAPHRIGHLFTAPHLPCSGEPKWGHHKQGHQKNSESGFSIQFEGFGPRDLEIRAPRPILRRLESSMRQMDGRC